MKKFIFAFLTVALLTANLYARDFIVEFMEENYKESQAAFSYSPLIYHSIQVTSAAGPKLLVLTGNNYHYRSWIRQYISKNKKFIAKVPDNDNDLFISSKA